MYEQLKKYIEQLEAIEIKNYETGKEARYILQQMKVETQRLRVLINNNHKNKTYSNIQ